MNLIQKLLLFTVMFSYTSLYSQDSSLQQDLLSLPTKYFNKLQDKYESLGESLDKRAAKMLNKARKSEERLFKQLWKKDSAKAKELFGDVRTRYAQLQSQAKDRAAKLTVFSKLYSGRIDSLTTSLKFLEGTDLVPASIREKLPKGMEGLSALQGKLDQAEIIRKALQERRKELAAALANSGLGKYVKDFNKQVYYYQQQVNEYKDLLKDPTKLEAKLITVLSKIPQFKEFLTRNSQVGRLFQTSTNANNTSSAPIVGLQSRSSTLQSLQSRFGSSSQMQQVVQQNIQSAQGRLSQIKEKVNHFLPQGGSGEEELPEFKPNTQRTKSFWKRLEWGTNIQNVRGNGLLPSTSDLGISLGYKLNDNSIVGIGGSYRLGLSNQLRRLKISHQGAGIRTFLDYKVKGSFFASGGYEINFFPTLRGVRVEPASGGAGINLNGRSQSGLIGIQKVVSLNSNLFKKMKAQVLWDFLSYRQVPRTQPVLFRINYNF
ncbi:MAG: hypothetical protein J0M30_02770 [Chitinophagales bacterium]|nr:hypothetical protein [Chitinophagales bacterium]